MSLDYAKEVLAAEARAIQQVADLLDDSFVKAVDMVTGCDGMVVLTGMGKAGIIAQKISATLASTGTPSLFLHPAEALHGDLGRIADSDVVVMLSNSGATEEVVDLIGPVRRIGAKIIGLTGAKDSPLGGNCDLLLNIGKIEEACPLKLAPSASTTAMLALGDALALAALNRRRESGAFGIEDYAAVHPGGALGRSLMKVTEIMRAGNAAPVVKEDATVTEVVRAISDAKAGAAVVVDSKGKMTGIFTDGDLRRYLLEDHDVRRDRIGDVMVTSFTSLPADASVADALNIFKNRKIGEIPVADKSGKPLGVVNLKDISGFEVHE
jgi:arabinose-5-phosphate isomerase